MKHHDDLTDLLRQPTPAIDWMNAANAEAESTARAFLYIACMIAAALAGWYLGGIHWGVS